MNEMFMGFPAREVPHAMHRIRFDYVQFVENLTVLPEYDRSLMPLPVEKIEVPLELSPSGNIRMAAHRGELYWSKTHLDAEWTQDDMLMARTMLDRMAREDR